MSRQTDGPRRGTASSLCGLIRLLAATGVACLVTGCGLGLGAETRYRIGDEFPGANLRVWTGLQLPSGLTTGFETSGGWGARGAELRVAFNIGYAAFDAPAPTDTTFQVLARPVGMYGSEDEFDGFSGVELRLTRDRLGPPPEPWRRDDLIGLTANFGAALTVDGTWGVRDAEPAAEFALGPWIQFNLYSGVL